MKYLLSMLIMISISINLFCQGSLLLVGGGAESEGGWSDAPFSWMVTKAENGVIINIDTDEASDWYTDYFISLGADNQSQAVSIPAEEANNEAIFELLSNADGIFIEGGDQSSYLNAWKNTMVETAIETVFESGGVIGGTSAGLAVLGEIVFSAEAGSAYPEDVAHNPYNEYLTFEDDFLEILPNTIIDTHFHERGRMGRLMPMLARRVADNSADSLLAIGVENSSALAIDSLLVGKIFGESVTFLRFNPDFDFICEPGRPLTASFFLDQFLDSAKVDLNDFSVLANGAWMNEVNMGDPPDNYYNAVSLDGNEESCMEYGDFTANNIFADPDAWWYGDIFFTEGEGLLPASMIITAIWDNSDYFANVWTAAIMNSAQNDFTYSILMDSNSVVEINQQGSLTTSDLTYLIDNNEITHSGSNSYGISGIVGGKIYCMGPGDGFELNNNTSSGEELTQNTPMIRCYPNPIILASNDEKAGDRDLKIIFSIKESQSVRINIFNLKGKLINCIDHNFYKAGQKIVNWNLKDKQNKVVGTGIYFCKLKTKEKSIVSKILVIR